VIKKKLKKKTFLQ